MTDQKQWREKIRARILRTVQANSPLSLRELQRRTSYRRGPSDSETNMAEWFEVLRALEGQISFEEADGTPQKHLADCFSRRIWVLTVPQKKSDCQQA